MRGQQFPLHNAGYFQSSLGQEHTHTSSHEVDWGTGAGSFKEPLTVRHSYDEQDREGKLSMHDEDGREVAKLDYQIRDAERATSLRVQPVIHTHMIEVQESHEGSGLATAMMSRLGQAHPGVSHPASNHLSPFGAPWRAHRVERGLDSGERLAEGPWESDPSMTMNPRIFRPVEPHEVPPHPDTGKPLDTRAWLMEEGHFDPHDTQGEDLDHDKWASRKSKVRKARTT